MYVFRNLNVGSKGARPSVMVPKSWDSDTVIHIISLYSIKPLFSNDFNLLLTEEIIQSRLRSNKGIVTVDMNGKKNTFFLDTCKRGPYFTSDSGFNRYGAWGLRTLLFLTITTIMEVKGGG